MEIHIIGFTHRSAVGASGTNASFLARSGRWAESTDGSMNKPRSRLGRLLLAAMPARHLLVLTAFWLIAVLPGKAVSDSSSPQSQSLAAPSTAASVDGRLLDAYTIPQLPDWADRYAHTDLNADVRFFRIQKLMTDFGYSRFEAVEVQNHYRDLTAAGISNVQAFARALFEVRAGHFGSGLSLDKLRRASFIVVYDLDETLYQTFYKSGSRGPAWRDFAYKSRGQDSYIKLRPGWEHALRRVRELGGLVLLFTARSDDIIESAMNQWTMDGKNIRQMVDGVFSKSHLVLQEKSDGEPVMVPSKDLRIFDETLQRVILVDDNPRRVLQHHRQRLIKKFQADSYLEVKNSATATSTLTASFEKSLPAVVLEIEESLAYVRAHAGVGFAHAYLPYTMLGQVALEALLQTGMQAAAARQYIREHPTYVDTDF